MDKGKWSASEIQSRTFKRTAVLKYSQSNWTKKSLFPWYSQLAAVYHRRYQLEDFSTSYVVKNPPAMWETWVRSLDLEDPLEKGQATYSSILAWRIPWIHPWGDKELDRTERLSLSFYMETNHKVMCLCILQPQARECPQGMFFSKFSGKWKVLPN